jgi:endo-1,4-beta-xylanase
MKAIYRIAGILLIVLPVLVASCKKGPELNVLATGDFGDNTMALKDATDIQMGAAISITPFLNDASYSGIVKRDFDAVTFEYHMKNAAIVQDNGSLNYTNTDALVAAVGPLDIFGHTLAWHDNVNANYVKNYAGIIQPAPIESLANGNFEAGGAGNFTNWSTYNAQNGSTVTVTTVPAEVRTGRAMKVINLVGEPANQWKVQVASDLFTTVAGKQYTATYWVKAASGTGSIRLSTQTSGGGSAQYQGDQSISSTAFSQISWTFTANSPQTRIVFDMAASLNTYFIDDASVKEVIPAPSGSQIVNKLDTALAVFITSTVNRYKNKVKAWDVVNEMLADDGNVRNNTNSPTPLVNGSPKPDWFVWSHYMGKNFALRAFYHAAAADPTATLYINDYNLESRPVKLDSLIKLVADLKAAGAKIDGIGTQMHISWKSNVAGIDAMMKKLAATGLKIRISELDIRTVDGSAAGKPTPELMGYQAAMAKYVVTSYMTHIPPAQRGGITVWGVVDKFSWLYNNGAEYPLLYDNNYNKKPAYAAVLQGLKQ